MKEDTYAQNGVAELSSYGKGKKRFGCSGFATYIYPRLFGEEKGE